MSYQSKNMSYIFYTEYFEGLDLSPSGRAQDNAEKALIKEKNDQLLNFQFQEGSPVSNWSSLEGFQEIVLYTTYPGLLIGSGNEHHLAKDGALKLGFSFDHVTGLPYIPGSSVKGMLRACFPGDKKTAEESEGYENYIRDILEEPKLDVQALKRDIFEGNDVFLGAFPEVTENGKLLGLDYITPHKDQFKGPNAISFLKVMPNVQFHFCFLLNDAEGLISAEEKRKLFETLLLDMGIGAKTNVGFGRFSKYRTKGVTDHCPPEPERKGNIGGGGQRHSGEAPKCRNRGCENSVTWNRKLGKWNPTCQECFGNHFSGRKF